MVFRASKDGYHSACKLYDVPSNKPLVVIGSIPAAIPFLIDRIAGSLGYYPDEVHLDLEPLPNGYTDILPSSEVLRGGLA